MSKCDLMIVFDRADRTYRPGEEIAGEVHVTVNKDLQCDRLLFQHFWQTHGRGNTATGTKANQLLDQGEWRAGQTFSHRFSVTAPNGPPTYRGHYLNIDHYVSLTVDIPWARDAKVKEEYILLPGDGGYGNLSTSRSGGRKAAQGFSTAGVPIGIILIIAGIIFACPFGVVLIPAGCAVLFFALRKTLAEKKIGTIRVNWGPDRVAPGGSASLRLGFSPRKSSRLNGITAKLTGLERCVSGSGTNKSTHTHKFHEQTVQLMRASNISAGKPIMLDGDIPIPDCQAYSFSASDNEIIWKLELRIDIPLWPDWIEERVLAVRPGGDSEVVTAALVGRQPRDDVVVVPTLVEAPMAPVESVEWVEPELVAPDESSWPDGYSEPVDQEPAQVDEPAAARELDEFDAPEDEYADEPLEEPATTMPDACDPALMATVEQLLAASRYGPARQDIIDELAGQTFQCSVELDRVDRTLSYGVDERFRDGRTVVGVIPGTDCRVAMLMSQEWNDRVESLERGGTITSRCTLSKWNNIYDRLDVAEA